MPYCLRRILRTITSMRFVPGFQVTLHTRSQSCFLDTGLPSFSSNTLTNLLSVLVSDVFISSIVLIGEENVVLFVNRETEQRECKGSVVHRWPSQYLSSVTRKISSHTLQHVVLLHGVYRAIRECFVRMVKKRKYGTILASPDYSWRAVVLD